MNSNYIFFTYRKRRARAFAIGFGTRSRARISWSATASRTWTPRIPLESKRPASTRATLDLYRGAPGTPSCHAEMLREPVAQGLSTIRYLRSVPEQESRQWGGVGTLERPLFSELVKREPLSSLPRHPSYIDAFSNLQVRHPAGFPPDDGALRPATATIYDRARRTLETLEAALEPRRTGRQLGGPYSRGARNRRAHFPAR